MFVYALFQKQRTSNKYSFIPYSGNSQEVTDKESLVRCPFNIRASFFSSYTASSSVCTASCSYLSHSVFSSSYLTISLSQLLTY
jgi:hypothetical protein